MVAVQVVESVSRRHRCITHFKKPCAKELAQMRVILINVGAAKEALYALAQQKD